MFWFFMVVSVSYMIPKSIPALPRPITRPDLPESLGGPTPLIYTGIEYRLYIDQCYQR